MRLPRGKMSFPENGEWLRFDPDDVRMSAEQRGSIILEIITAKKVIKSSQEPLLTRRAMGDATQYGAFL